MSKINKWLAGAVIVVSGAFSQSAAAQSLQQPATAQDINDMLDEVACEQSMRMAEQFGDYLKDSAAGDGQSFLDYVQNSNAEVSEVRTAIQKECPLPTGP